MTEIRPGSGPVLVVAVGGNALIADDAHVSAEDQGRQAVRTAAEIARLVADGWRVVVTHGNGPQVGFVLRRSELARAEVTEEPLVYAVADTQGSIGFMLAQGLAHGLGERLGEEHADRVAAVVTRVVVDAEDPSFDRPTKPVGAQLSEEHARRLAEQHGWQVAEDSGRGWRRVVASPAPVRVLETGAVRTLLEAGHVVVAGGGGGIPVVERDGVLEGVDAVIDKDATSALLAAGLGAQVLLVLTSVPHVSLGYGTPEEETLGGVGVEEAERHLADGQFAEGSMGPKIRAAVDFVRSGPGRRAVITDAAHAVAAMRGEAGTRIG